MSEFFILCRTKWYLKQQQKNHLTHNQLLQNERESGSRGYMHELKCESFEQNSNKKKKIRYSAIMITRSNVNIRISSCFLNKLVICVWQRASKQISAINKCTSFDGNLTSPAIAIIISYRIWFLLLLLLECFFLWMGE